MVNQYKEVDFSQYCKTCEFERVPEDGNPCDECLESPVNLYSHKPVKWKEKVNE